MKTQSIEERINRLEDIEAIKTLTARYSNCINQGWNNKKIDVKGITQLFTKDAVWESTDMNISVSGIDEVVASLIKETQNVRLRCTIIVILLLKLIRQKLQEIGCFG